MYGSPSSLTKVAVYLFAFVMLLPSIPVACIVSKNNLIQNKLCRNGNFFGVVRKNSILDHLMTSSLSHTSFLKKDVATFLSFVIPWIGSIPFLTNSYALQQFQNWTSLLFVGASNFIVPLIIYLKCHSFRSAYNRDRGILNTNQRQLLKTIHSHSREIAKWVDYKGEDKSGLKSHHSRPYYNVSNFILSSVLKTVHLKKKFKIILIRMAMREVAGEERRQTDSKMIQHLN
jgi:hypothetical protein